MSKSGRRLASYSKSGTTTTYKYNTWNDIMNPNYMYESDRQKAEFAHKIPFANPTDYTVSISWTENTVIRANSGTSSGWLK